MPDPRPRNGYRPLVIGAVVILLALAVYGVVLGGSFFDNRDHPPATQDTTTSGAGPGAEPPAAK